MKHLHPLGIAILLSLGLTGLPGVSAQSTLEEYQKRQAVAAQALEKEIRDAVKEAKRLLNDGPAALKLLEEAKAKLDKAEFFQIAKKAELSNLLKDAIHLARNPHLAMEKSPADRLPPTPKEVEDLIKAEINAILELQKQGRTAEAAALTEKLIAAHPTLLVPQQTRATLTQGQAVADEKRAREARGQGNLSAMNSVEKSATPMGGDIQYPPDFLEKMRKRKERYEAQLKPTSKREKELLRWLNTPITAAIGLKDQPFEQALKFIEQELGQGLMLNKRTLDELRIDYSTPVSLTVPRGSSRGAVLTALLEQLGMTYIIKNEQITILSKEEASRTLVTRVIPVDSLVGGVASNMTPDQLIRYIEDTIAPESWKRNDGQGTISYFPGARVLIIRNSAAVISILEKGL